MPVLLYGSETIIWREKERSRIRVVQMGRMDRVPNARIRELCGVAKGVDESVLRWFGRIQRMENDRIVKKVYVGECVGSRLVGRLQKSLIDSVNDRLKEKRFKWWASKKGKGRPQGKGGTTWGRV